MPTEQVLLAFGKVLVSLAFEISPFNLPSGAGGSWRRPCAHDVLWQMLTVGQAEATASSAEMQSRALAPICHPAL